MALRIAITLILLLSAVAQRASADVYYAATGDDASVGILYTLDPATGAATPVGPLVDTSAHIYLMTGMDFQPGTHVLYGSTTLLSPTNPGHLVTIDPATGLVTDIGSFGVPSTFADIAFDPTTGIFYGVQSADDHWLYTINLTTGAATKVGVGNKADYGGDGLAVTAGGTMFNTPDGNYNPTFGAPTIRTVNKTDGTETFVAFLNGGPTPRNIDAMKFDSSGTLFGIQTDHNSHTNLVLINTTSGLLTTVGPSASSLDALAILLAVPPDAFQVKYAANLAAGQSVVNISNENPNQLAICANVYVFAEDEQLIACCTCPITPNGLATLSVQNDLISNTLTPGVPNAVTVELLATAPGVSGTCNAGAPGGAVAGMRAWGTTLHAAPGGAFQVTEAKFSQVVLSASEENRTVSLCNFIQADGSGYGICAPCRAGAAGAAKQ